MKNTAWQLGLAGLVPFLFLPLFATLGSMTWQYAAFGFQTYSAIILSFFGGIHWYDALNGNPSRNQIYVAMLPSIVAWLCVFVLPFVLSFGVLSVSYLLVMIYDKQVLQMNKKDIIWYTKLRMFLTTVVVLCHAWMIYALT